MFRLNFCCLFCFCILFYANASSAGESTNFQFQTGAKLGLSLPDTLSPQQFTLPEPQIPVIKDYKISNNPATPEMPGILSHKIPFDQVDPNMPIKKPDPNIDYKILIAPATGSGKILEMQLHDSDVKMPEPLPD